MNWSMLWQLSVALQCDGFALVAGEQSVARATIEIEGNGGRIAPPSVLLPPISGRGHDGWWSLENLEVSDLEVRGRFALNWINKPTVIVDRRSGVIIIRASHPAIGQSEFQGDCRPISQTRVF
jgi:hypothetical protein